MMSKKKRAQLRREKEQKEAQYRKRLKALGIDKNYIPPKEREFVDYMPKYSSRGAEHRARYPSLSTNSGSTALRDDTYKKEISAQYNIGQASNFLFSQSFQSGLHLKQW